jgi:hypothetical protein
MKNLNDGIQAQGKSRKEVEDSSGHANGEAGSNDPWKGLKLGSRLETCPGEPPGALFLCLARS